MRILAILIIAAGIFMRLYIYFQNRNLIIDEANVARNIFERGYLTLLAPLDYQQYAPPGFLWIVKTFTLILGMGEKALRLYSLICGIAAFYVLYRILKEILPVAARWYPLALFACSPAFIRYSSELKQYMPDVFITLLLIWLALSIDILKKTAKQFTIWWIVIGSFAVWFSMPTVFILAGVGFYYGWECLKTKEYKKIIPLLLASAIWVIQFSIYYFTILEPQANSDYLQNFHHYDFLFATPTKPEEWNHNWHVFSELMRQFEGLYPYVHDINTAFLIGGVIMLARKAGTKFFLLVVPVLSVGAAAALDQFSLMPRVALFIIPVLILIISYGFAQFAYLRSVVLKGIILIAAIYAAACNIAYMQEKPFKYEELTTGMKFMQDNDIPSPAISVYHSSIPAFLYYTTIHPGKEQWSDIKNADTLQWYINYDSLGWQMRHVWSSRQPLGFLYTNATEKEFNKRNNGIRKHMQVVDSIRKDYIRSYIYIKPEE